MPNMPIPSSRSSCETDSVIRADDHVLMTKGRAGTNEKKSRERRDERSAMITSTSSWTIV